jgi:UDP-N-acetylmuramoyl-L-alanyl-D-glutamate--2,6-diaminopimelate ligase
MMLKEILNGCEYSERLPGDQTGSQKDISGIAYDSRDVKEGYLFVAIKGEKFDGHDFIRNAVDKGATAIVCEHTTLECGTRDAEMNPPVSCIYVKDSRKALACIANNFYERPSEALTLIGITGTNGKTTTTYILKSILEAWGRNVGLTGTIRYMIKDRIYPAIHTTPESPEFQSLLKEMLLSGCTHIISEVSSHALAQHRVDHIAFDTAVFTNLTRDHLDFHKTMEEYFIAKQRLFQELLDNDGTAVINLDDPYGMKLISLLRPLKNRKILTYGITGKADITADNVVVSFEGLRFQISFRGEQFDVTSPLIGKPNVYNILSAAGAAYSLNIPWKVILESIAKTGSVTGRFEKVQSGQQFLCLIDYAHTEDALERLILTAREILGKSQIVARNTSSRIITVFGCGGDRDKGKRPKMGEIATRLSDVVIITSDNPRSEEPEDIIRDIEEGAMRKNYLIEPDRRTAIHTAVQMANKGDIVLIAGKGHEDYQEIKDARYRFSDRDVLRDAINSQLKAHDVQ